MLGELDIVSVDLPDGRSNRPGKGESKDKWKVIDTRVLIIKAT